MPIGEARVDDIVEPDRIHRIGDVQQDAVPGTGPGRQTQLRERGDVVAVVALAGALRARPVVAAAPQAGGVSGLRIPEHERPIDDARLLRPRHRDPDDVDPEERGRRVLGRQLVGATLQFLLGANGGGPGAVDVDIALVVRVGHDGVGMRSAAGLHRRHLPGHPHVADVEDPDTAEALGAHRLRDSLQAAVEASPRLLDRHDQQVAHHRDIALTAGADHGRDQLRRGRNLDAVRVEPVEAADEHLIAGEREVRVAEVEQSAPLRRLLLFLLFGVVFLVLLVLLVFLFPLRRRVGIEEAVRLRARRHERHVPDGLAGVIEAGREAHPRIDGQLREHGVHPVDLHALVRLHVGGEREKLRILRRPALIQKVLDHRQGAAMVLDHQFEEETVERDSLRRLELVHLLRRQHARHRHPAGRMMRIRRRHRLAALAQPLLHHLDLVFLGKLDALRYLPHRVARGAGIKQRGHLQRLRVVGNHPLHEPHIGLAIPDGGEIGGFGRRDRAARLTRRTGLHDGRLLRPARRRAKGQERQDGRHHGGGSGRLAEMLKVHGCVSRQCERATIRRIL